MKFIRYPADRPGRDCAGGKAATLAALHGRGVMIPDWFVILPGAFDGEPADGADLHLKPAALVEIREALVTLCPLGEEVAVRSSALDEDGSDCSFAGQLESFLMVPHADVAQKIGEVGASAFSDRIQVYRAQHGLSASRGLPAVIVQRMVPAEAAGVAFGADPVSGRRDVAVVAAVPGLGSALVDGSTQGDMWQVDLTGRVIERRPAEDGLGASAVSDESVLEVASLARRAGELLGCPQDIEWAIAEGGLYLLQSRPITTLPKDGGLNIWDNSNITESYSGVTLPLTFSFARRAYTGVYRQFCMMLAVPGSRITANERTFQNMLGLIRGRVYYNLLNWYRVLALLPGFTLNRRFMEQMMGVKEELPPEALAGLGKATGGARLMDAAYVMRSLAALAMNHWLLPYKIRRFYRRLDEALAPAKPRWETLTMEELTGQLDDLEKRLLTRWDAPLLNDFFAMIFHGVLRQLLCKWANDRQGTLANDLLCGEGGMISAEPARLILKMAALAAPHARLVRQLCDGALPELLKTMESVPLFHAAYLEYLEKFGDRCLGELKLESQPLPADPTVLLRAVGELASRPVSQGDSRSKENDLRKQAEQEIGQALAPHPARRLVLNWVLRNARARVRDRENLRFERTRLFGRARRLFIEMGRRLHDDGRLEDPRDIFLLEVDEVRDFAAGSGAELGAIVARRRVEFAGYEKEPAPPDRFSTRGPVEESASWESAPPAHEQEQGENRRGTGCCAGHVRGRVRKVTNPRNAVIRSGEILVAERTDPGWIMLFPGAAGLLVERGSLLSHSAIVAREMRIPAIVSIPGLMAWLNDGDLVEFDGASGEIRRVDGQEPANSQSLSSINETGAALAQTEIPLLIS